MYPFSSRYLNTNKHSQITYNSYNNPKPISLKFQSNLMKANSTIHQVSYKYRNKVKNYSTSSTFDNAKITTRASKETLDSKTPTVNTHRDLGREKIQPILIKPSVNYKPIDYSLPFNVRTKLQDMHPGILGSTWKSVNLSKSIGNDMSTIHVKQEKVPKKLNCSLEIVSAIQKDVLASRKPIGPHSALKNYRLQLTSLEQDEILNFSNIWYLGLKAKKREAVGGASPNNGYDDNRGSYVKVLHDHIAYRYEILETLGSGSFGQVFKAIDHQSNQKVAIKVIRNKKRFHQQSQIEIRLLNYLKKKEQESQTSFHIIHLLNSFSFRNHPCLVFELLGNNLYDIIKRNNFKGLSLSDVQKIAFKILCCLSVLNKENIIHCDLKPENVLLINNNSCDIKLIDFGSSCFTNERTYTYIQSRFYRSPEVILGIPYSTQIDIWSFGCMLPELLTGKPIFPGETEIDQLACIMEVFGLPPKSVMNQATRKRLFFDCNGIPRNIVNSKGYQRIPDSQTVLSKMKMNIDAKLLDLIHCCLQWDSNFRIKPEKALKHSWFDEFQKDGSSPNNEGSSEKKHDPQINKNRIALKDKENLIQNGDSNGTIKEKECLPSINSDSENKSELSLKENVHLSHDVMSNKTILPSVYQRS